MELMPVSCKCVEMAVLVAIEPSKSSWLLAVHDPITDRISRRRLASGDAAGLIAIVEKARAAGCAIAAGGHCE